MSSGGTPYPDISDILERKERGRKKLASLPFAEKIRILEAMREQFELIRRARPVPEDHEPSQNPRS